MASTGDFQLRPFQKLVLQHVLNGRSVILQAPTGSGKTKAALAPFLQNLAKQGDKLPHTCRYAVPMRVLANQFYREFQSTVIFTLCYVKGKVPLAHARQRFKC